MTGGEFPDVQEVQQAAKGHGPRDPRAGPGGAAVRGRGPVGIQDGHAPSSGRVPGRGGDQVPDVGVIDDPEPGYLTGRPEIAVHRGMGHGDRDIRADSGTRIGSGA